MLFCKNCGTPLEDKAKFCPLCGAARAPIPTEDAALFNQMPEIILNSKVSASEQKASGQLNIFQLFWSILNLLCCCLPVGIVSLVMVVLAKSALSAEEEARKLRFAKLMNIIGTVLFFIVMIVSLIISLTQYPI